MNRRFLAETRGNIAVVFSLALPAVLASVGLAVDGATWFSQQKHLQSLADTAALSAAKVYMETNDTAAMEQVSGDLIAAHNLASVSASTVLTAGDAAVRVELSQPATTYFAGLFSVTPPPITSSSEASLAASAGACVLALEPSAGRGIWLDSNAEIDAPNCAVHANSSSSSGIDAYSNSEITAEAICVVGDYSGGLSHFNPAPDNNCAPVSDPLAAVSPPGTSGCDEDELELDDANTTLDPGVFCDGLEIKGNSDITFNPGTYVIKDGEFFVDSNSQISGSGVTFYLTGEDATLFFDSNVVVDFTAPTSGSLAGIIFFEDRSASLLQEHRLFSNNISRLEGAVYLSRGVLWLDSNSQIAASSDFTTVIVRRLRLDSNARLVLNSNYDASSVPAVGVSSGSSNLRLVR